MHFGPFEFSFFVIFGLGVGFGLGIGWNERVRRGLERRNRRLGRSLARARRDRDELTERLALRIMEETPAVARGVF